MGKKRQKQHASKRFLKGASLKEKREMLGLSTWASGYGGMHVQSLAIILLSFPLNLVSKGDGGGGL